MHWPWERAKERLSEELESHLQMAIAERVARGEDRHRPAQPHCVNSATCPDRGRHARALGMDVAGKSSPRYSLCAAPASPRSRIYGNGAAHAGLWHRRESRRVPATLCSGSGRAACSSSGRSCQNPRCAQSLRSELDDFLSRIPASARRHSRCSTDGDRLCRGCHA